LNVAGDLTIATIVSRGEEVAPAPVAPAPVAPTLQDVTGTAEAHPS
jgi:hypothetical protein